MNQALSLIGVFRVGTIKRAHPTVKPKPVGLNFWVPAKNMRNNGFFQGVVEGLALGVETAFLRFTVQAVFTSLFFASSPMRSRLGNSISVNTVLTLMPPTMTAA
ncbi:MAG: hypothetical protein L3J01_04750, partial [Thiomicrorhabdus sp.]|nr:hypothetical protein [Thiomicrorhabdus sp.]